MKRKNINILLNTALLAGAAATLTLNSCSEKIDESDLYTFTGEMMTDHFANNPEQFSSYLTILNRVTPSKRSASSMSELLNARGGRCPIHRLALPHGGATGIIAQHR